MNPTSKNPAQKPAASPQQLAKLKGHSDQLLDAFLVLKERSIFVHAALFNHSIVKAYNAKGKGRGFMKITNDLYFYCIQDVAKLALDNDSRVASVANLVAAIQLPGVKETLKQSFSKWTLAFGTDDDAQTRAFLTKEYQKETQKRETDFDTRFDKLVEDWETFNNDVRLLAYLKIRNKLTAHFDLDPARGYAPYDIKQLGLKWGDLKLVIREVERYVLELNLLIRSSSFLIADFDKTALKDATAFWS